MRYCIIKSGVVINTVIFGGPPESYPLVGEEEIRLEAECDDLPRAEVAPTEPSVDQQISTLGAAFKQAVPEEFHGRFGSVFASVRVLLLAGEPELALATVEATIVPQELESVKQQILLLLNPNYK